MGHPYHFPLSLPGTIFLKLQARLFLSVKSSSLHLTQDQFDLIERYLAFGTMPSGNNSCRILISPYSSELKTVPEIELCVSVMLFYLYTVSALQEAFNSTPTRQLNQLLFKENDLMAVN